VSPIHQSFFVGAVGGWIGILLVGILAMRMLSWEAVRVLAPLVDLLGTWAGTLAVITLVLGRESFGFAWATAMVLVALMLTASLYDRAVLMPSLEAAFKRLQHAAGRAKWEDEWAFLWRMATWGRAGTLVAGVGALLCGLAT
jgi:hypothetical protein